MQKKISFNGNPITLVGKETKTNTLGLSFTVVSKELKDKNLPNYNDKIKIIHSFPSLDTQVCDLQVKEFNKRAKNLSKDIIIIGISKDLPFAQNRFCKTFSIDTIDLYSDYKYSSFGISYGLLIKELNLLARACLILDKNNVIRYFQIADDITHSLNFEALFSNLNDVLKNPSKKFEIPTIPTKCTPCEKGTLPLNSNKTQSFLKTLQNWTLIDNKKIQKELIFKDFVEAKYFLDMIAIIAQEQKHHPEILLNYNKLKITLTTHAIDGLSVNDFIIAKIIDEMTTN